MIFTLLTPLVPVLILLVGLVPVAALVYWWRRNDRLHARQSPLTRELLRPPGHSLRNRITAFDKQIEELILAAVLVPITMYAVHVSQSYFGGVSENGWRIGTSLLFVAVAEVLIGKRLLPLLNERRNSALGLDGELATAEELNQLMLDGCRVFHDVPIRYGNVDHVVVSHSGLYAVNTKMLGKPPKDNGNADVVVDHEKNVIRFSGWQYPIPIDKLTTEARCLSDYLTSAVGKEIKAEPMIALPGWYVKERIGRGPVYVFNPRNPQRFFVQSRQVLSEEVVQQVAHQLEQLCRNVEPVFQEKKGWEHNKGMGRC